MNCKFYKNTNCICVNEESDGTKINIDYCCQNCVIHLVVLHDEMLEDGSLVE